MQSCGRAVLWTFDFCKKPFDIHLLFYYFYVSNAGAVITLKAVPGNVKLSFLAKNFNLYL